VNWPGLDEVPLHPLGRPFPESYWACTQPERPWQPETMYDMRCPACLIHAEATLMTVGDLPTIIGGGARCGEWVALGTGTLEQYVANGKRWFEEQQHQ
jgi:hypothetical protein